MNYALVNKANLVKNLLFCATAILIGLSQITAVVSADATCPSGLSTLDCQAINFDWTQWIPDDCGVNGSTTVTLIGNDNLQQIFNYFAANGYTTQQAAGITGNIYAESHGDPEIWEGDGKDYQIPPTPDSTQLGWGITQWTPASKILNYAQTTGQPAYELSTQVAFLWNQLNGTSPNNSEKPAGDMVKKTSTIDEAALAFMQYYERPANDGPTSQNALVREKLSEEVFALYAASAPSPNGSITSTLSGTCSNTGSGPGGTVVGCNFPNTGGSSNNLYTTNTSIVYPGVATMCQRAQLLAAGQLINLLAHPPVHFCANGSCFGKCDYVAGISWGYDNYSGYSSAYDHWQTMIKQGHAHPGDRNPPVGALLFYEDPSTKGFPANDFGHVVVYLGNNMVISSDISPTGQYSPGSISIVPAYKIEARGFGDPYLGWSDPIFAGPKDPNF